MNALEHSPPDCNTSSPFEASGKASRGVDELLNAVQDSNKEVKVLKAERDRLKREVERWEKKQQEEEEEAAKASNNDGSTWNPFGKSN